MGKKQNNKIEKQKEEVKNIEKDAIENKEEIKNIEEDTTENKEEVSVTKKEEKVSIQEIKQTIKKKQNLPKEEIEKINKVLFQNIIIAVCITIYFIFLNLGNANINPDIYLTDLKVFGICVLFLAIAIIEKAYKEDNGTIAIYGIEMIVLAIVTLSLIYVKLMYSSIYAFVITSISYILVIYYLIKSIIIYIKKRHEYFVNGMKKIIKDEIIEDNE